MTVETTVDPLRLDKLEDHALKTEGRLGIIEQTQSIHGTKLDQIVQAVTTYGARPVFDAHRTVSLVRDVVVMASVFSSLAVWLVLTLTSANDKVTETRLMYQERQIHELVLKGKTSQ